MYEPKTEEQMNEFKKFVDGVIDKELFEYEEYDENGVGQRRKNVYENINYDTLVGIAYKDFIKEYYETAEYYLIEDLFYI